MDALEIRIIDGELVLCVPMKLIARLAQARTPRAERRGSATVMPGAAPKRLKDPRDWGSRAAGAALIAETIEVLAEIDPDRQGARPVHILRALDARGFSFHPDRPAPERVALLASHLWRERRRAGGQLRLQSRARYAALAAALH